MAARYIIDTSVLVQGYIDDSETKRVLTLLKQLFADTEENRVELFVPEFCLMECVNVFWKQVRFHEVPLEQLQIGVKNLITTPLTVQPAARFLDRALSISVNDTIAVYDSIYIAMSEVLKFPLITVDSKQASVAKSLGVKLKSITDFPPIDES